MMYYPGKHEIFINCIIQFADQRVALVFQPANSFAAGSVFEIFYKNIRFERYAFFSVNFICRFLDAPVGMQSFRLRTGQGMRHFRVA
ncbi:MAG: hypothetical protein FD123_4214 [Bacteroidetes bacterium]|nr:MAG: hypothetical protein FD123_4214 [Bacteroidota bacterium]